MRSRLSPSGSVASKPVTLELRAAVGVAGVNQHRDTRPKATSVGGLHARRETFTRTRPAKRSRCRSESCPVQAWRIRKTRGLVYAEITHGSRRSIHATRFSI